MKKYAIPFMLVLLLASVGSTTPTVQGVNAAKINGIVPYRVNGIR